MFRAPIAGLVGVLFSLLVCSASAADTAAHSRLNASAQMISGLSPASPALNAFMQSAAWEEHRAFMHAAWKRLNDRQAAPMAAWRDGALPKACPAGKTLMYPFSGPDFFNAHWLFPGCETIVMFGLEHIGAVPDLESLSERDLVQLLAEVRVAMKSFLERNYFITDNMARQLRSSQLRGVLPVFMLSMALMGMDIVSIAPYELAPLSRPDAPPDGRPMRNLRGVTIEYRATGSPATQRVHYFTVDATDKGLAHFPEFLAFVRTLGPATTFIKSASYLLHGNEFRQIRAALLDISAFIVQDDSGMPYAMLERRDWRVDLYGRYGRPIRPFGGAFQAGLDQAFKAQHPAPLPFTFGYQYRDFRDQRSNLMVARRSSTGEKATVRDEVRGTPFNSVATSRTAISPGN